MVTKSLLGALLIGAGFFLSDVAFGDELPGKWTLSIENPEHVVVATLTVKFTDKPARSCMRGEWKVLKVVSAKTRDPHFFPASDPLSYRIEGSQLTMGRNELCDAYLWLRGSLGGPSVKGDYFSLGLEGSAPRGYFEMSPAR
ncbi:hypothetical protein L2Y94_11110 [Luteibacter aegosomatis]|uniref:hypothetical protein n=1 Tax=Luteibacter aegosomatis TaxID=2911537 RepID=UPI001FFB0F68|nr:hypothetical protein [Luteibacter aegosomatis]UPG83907.1 hypothetical protein L2Y94_11110 [Luteibacter aegosomatis]